jgi:hypothetical protein
MRGLIKVVNGLRGIASEPVRSCVAHLICDMITDQVAEENYKIWISNGVPQFMESCGVTCAPAAAEDALSMETSELATLVSKWTAVKVYKDGDTFRDFTQEMDGIRNAILEDLRYGCQLGDI